MKYDRDIIATIYLLQQTDEALASRMWNRFVETQQKNTVNDLHVTPNFIVPADVVAFVKYSSEAGNKVDAIRIMRMKTGWGLKESKDAVDMMLAKGILK